MKHMGFVHISPAKKFERGMAIMKKHLIAAFVVTVICIMGFTGCSAAKIFEKDLQAVLEVDGKYYGCYTVNIFNNAVVSEPEAPQGKTFKGWTVQETWAEEEADNVPVMANKSLIRYDDIKDYVVGSKTSVTLSAVFVPVPRRDLVIAWYNNNNSKITEENMQDFETKLYTYLATQNYTPESMDIVIRGYTGQVGDSCSAIKKDSDVDIMVGWSGESNLSTQASWEKGKDYIDIVGGIRISEKDRYAARLTDTELSRLVYNWIQSEYGTDEAAPTETPEVSKVPEATKAPEASENSAEEKKLVIGWYAKTETTGITQEMVSSLETVLLAYLTENSLMEHPDVEIREISGDLDVAAVGELVNTAGDFDILMGMGKNITSTGGIATLEKADYQFGSANRNIALLSNSGIGRIIFDWMQTEEVKAVFAPADEGV